MGEHSGTTAHGTDYTLRITPATVFRDYETAGMERAEVAAGEGVITINQFLPDEMNEWQARALAAMLQDAADELERQDAAAVEEVAGRRMLGELVQRSWRGRGRGWWRWVAG